jgi:hypothetical protein
LAILLSVLPRFTVSDYPFGIFKLFIQPIEITLLHHYITTNTEFEFLLHVCSVE